MLYQITDGTVSVGGHVILSHVDFEIKGNEKIALVGRNGAGKTTLLKLIAGELSLDRDDRRQGAGVTSSRRLTVGMLKQQAFSDREQSPVEKILLAACRFAIPLRGNGLNMSRSMTGSLPALALQGLTSKKRSEIFPEVSRRRSR